MPQQISTAQKAINFLIKNRDIHYLQSINATGSADLIKFEKNTFTPGATVYQALINSKKATIACNIVYFNQIEGHIRAAMNQNSALVFEIARSQLDYALDEKKAVGYIKKMMAKTKCNIPIVMHGDHIQYTPKLFSQKEVLQEVYKEKTGQELDEKTSISDIDLDILKEVNKKLIKNTQKERAAVTAVIEKLIKAGFTSMAIDASTIYDEIASDAIFNYYENNGSNAEKLIVKLEKDFSLSLEWGTAILKLDIENDKAKFDEIREDIISEMKKRGKSDDQIKTRIIEFENAFGRLAKAGRENNITLKKLVSAYDKILEDNALATITGKIRKEILASMDEKEKLLLLPTSNAEETSIQLKKINELVKKYCPKMIKTFGIEVEVGHVDKKVPNPRMGGKLESKVTHPLAVKAMCEYLQNKKLRFNLIATNNGSGHGTEFDKQTLTPVSQVDKISPYLTGELQKQAESYGGTLAQHGTSGSDMDELAELARKGISKFNIATNYQHILLNILSLLDNGLGEDKLMDKVWEDQLSLMAGLDTNTRENIKAMAREMIDKQENLRIKNNDSLFRKIMIKTYFWGIKKGKINNDSSEEDIAAILAKEYRRIFGEMDNDFYELGSANNLFKIGHEIKQDVAEDISVKTSVITAAVLTMKGLRGRAKNLDNNIPEQKLKIGKIKDEADGLAKKIYEKVIKNNNIILAVKASEGFGRDNVAESFRADDLIVCDQIKNEMEKIKKAIKNKEKIYKAANGQKYPIENAIIDVIENTNSFVSNIQTKSLQEIGESESGGSSIIVTGAGVESIGNYPDYYACAIHTIVPKEKRADFIKNPLDPEIVSADPKKQEEVLQRIASANDLEISDLQIVLMDRTRENEKLAVLQKLQDKHPGLQIIRIKDGTVAHSILANLGKKSGKHIVLMTTPAAPEAFYNLCIASIFKEDGSLASLRICSKNMNKTKGGQDINNLERRYDFDEEEIETIKQLRPKDYKEIISGKKLFTQEDVKNDVSGSFAFITHSGVFGMKGATELPQNYYEVSVLRMKKVGNKPCAWIEKKVIDPSEYFTLT